MHISPCGKSWLLFCVPNCVLVVVWLSVLCVSSWWCHGLVLGLKLGHILVVHIYFHNNLPLAAMEPCAAELCNCDTP